jgi:predicted TIM-barrel fold metal-dependent hydrolase
MAVDLMPQMNEQAPQGAIAYLKRLYYDTAIAATSYTFQALQALVEPTQILFGSDYPYLPEELTEATVQGVSTYDGFDAQTRIAIERENGLKLFPRLHSNLI